MAAEEELLGRFPILADVAVLAIRWPLDDSAFRNGGLVAEPRAKGVVMGAELSVNMIFAFAAGQAIGFGVEKRTLLGVPLAVSVPLTIHGSRQHRR